MTDHTKKNVQGLAGRLDGDAVDQFGDHRTEATTKPEVDLVSWAALGQSVKPSRSDRRRKRGRKQGAI